MLAEAARREGVDLEATAEPSEDDAQRQTVDRLRQDPLVARWRVQVISRGGSDARSHRWSLLEGTRR